MCAWFAADPEHPELAPDGSKWSDFVLNTLRGGQEYDAASPWPARVPQLPWSSDKGDTQPFITQNVAEIAPYLSDEHLKDLPQEDQDLLRGWTTGTTENVGHKDSMNFFGEPFFTALMGLGLIGGAAALAGAFAAPAAGGAAAAGAIPAAEAAPAAALGGTLGGYATTASLPATLGASAGTLAGSTAPIVGTGAVGAAGAGGSLLSALGLAAPTTPLGWASLGASGLSGLSSLVGGIQGASAAKAAAATQAASATDANKLLADIYTQQRTALDPYRQLGTASLGELLNRVGQRPAQPLPRFNLAAYR